MNLKKLQAVKRPYREVVKSDEIKFNFSSAYDKDYVTVQEGNNCIAIDITDNKIKTELISILSKLNEENYRRLREGY